MERLAGFDGYIDDEVLGWLQDAEQVLDEFDVGTDHYYPEMKEALQRLEQARQMLKAIREPIAHLIETEIKSERERESWTP